jgi:rare lipoprotein A
MGRPYPFLFAVLLVTGACASSARRPPAVLPPAPSAGAARPQPTVEPGWTQIGIASWYGPGYDGRRTSSGEVFDPDALTAAHPTLPFDTHVRVTYLANGRSVVVRINDRSPRRDRIIDLSRGAARALDLIGPGTGTVRIEVVAP